MVGDSCSVLIDSNKYISKAQQHFIIDLRSQGCIFGMRGQQFYDSPRFYKSIKSLIEAGWIKKSFKEKAGRQCIAYELTGNGYKFFNMMTRYPAYRAAHDKFAGSFQM